MDKILLINHFPPRALKKIIKGNKQSLYFINYPVAPVKENIPLIILLITNLLIIRPRPVNKQCSVHNILFRFILFGLYSHLYFCFCIPELLIHLHRFWNRTPSLNPKTLGIPESLGI